MPTFGITGHINLTAPSKPLVYAAIIAALRPYAGAGLTGISCLAPGADTIFAQAVLDLDGLLYALVPAHDYRSRLGEPDRSIYDALLTSAGARVDWLDHAESGPTAFAAANRKLVGLGLDRLYAVWDGHDDPGRANTASVVRYAREHGVPIEIIWPAGAERESRHRRP